MLQMPNRVAIPRLLNSNTRHKSGRTGRACDDCRSRKAKCDGVRPTCYNCSKQQIQCRYSDSKRARERSELEFAKQRAENFEKVLREISREVDTHVARKIEKVLKTESADRHFHRNSSSISSVSSSLSSEGSVGYRGPEVLDENLNRRKESRATGYPGNASEVAWIRNLDVQADQIPGYQNKLGNSGQCPPSQAPRAAFPSVNHNIEAVSCLTEEPDQIHASPGNYGESGS